MSNIRRECPMCGEFMRLEERVETDRIPGTSQIATRTVSEWICPECDYFEEVAEDEQGGGGRD